MTAHHLTPPSNWTWNPTNGGTFLKFLEEATTDTSGNNATSPKFNASKVAVYGMEPDQHLPERLRELLADGRLPRHTRGLGLVDQLQHSGLRPDDAVHQRPHVQVPRARARLRARGQRHRSQAARTRTCSRQARSPCTWRVTGTRPPSGRRVGTKFKIGVVPLPAGPDGRWSVFNGLIDAVNIHTPNLQAAWQLEEWLGSAASQKIMGEGGYIWPAIPSLDSLFAKAWAAKGIPMAPFSQEAVGNVVDWPNTPGMNQALGDMQTAMGPIWLGRDPVQDQGTAQHRLCGCQPRLVGGRRVAVPKASKEASLT